MIVRDALRQATRTLAANTVPEPAGDARILVSHALGVSREALVLDPDRPLNEAARMRFFDVVARRSKREPISHILGKREFWSLPFAVDRHVLDPRPDSESVIEAALACIETCSAGLRILDLGTGSGCLLLALLSELPSAWGVGVDISETAVTVAQKNAFALHLAERSCFAVADWADALDAQFDLIVANPPYVQDAELATLQPEVACYEPRLALAGGDGYAAYREIALILGRLLASDARAVFECGVGQVDRVTDIFVDAGFERIAVTADLAGIERCVTLRKRSGP